MAEGPGAKIKDEVVAVFSTVEIRDTIRQSAKELGGERGQRIRLEIPYVLQSGLKLLESVSYHLKKKYLGIKRNIKFDDGEMDLILDFNIDPDLSRTWRRITPQQASDMKKHLNTNDQTLTMTDSELEDLLGQLGS